MNNDRELLELAAKAAGIESSIGLLPRDGVSIIQPDGKKWNPITDDGDALRLAVKLDLNVQVGVVRTPGGFTAIEYSDTGDRDDCELTRRAIFRAAAEIGRDMK